MLIVNADDWGRTAADTDASVASWRSGRITSVTAMVFMADSPRAAVVAREERIPVGLHLNFSEPFTAPPSNPILVRHQQDTARFLRFKYNQLLYNPLLTNAFDYIVRAQIDEFCRLYGRPPTHFDGHQHMHLCSNMLVQCPIPAGSKVRRSFSFEAPDKSFVNRAYRRLVDRRLATAYRLTDYFFCLSQRLQSGGFGRVSELASVAVVELMTHPVRPTEQAFLKSVAYARNLQRLALGSYLAV